MYAVCVIDRPESPPSNCDHSFIFAKMNISLVKPRCYERFIWDLHKVNVGDLVNALNSLHWDVFLLILMMLMYYIIDGCPVFVVSLICMYLVGLLLFVPGINHG